MVETNIDRPFSEDEIKASLNSPDPERFDKLANTYLDADALGDALEEHMVSFYTTDPAIVFIAGIMTALQILEERGRQAGIN